MLKRKAALAQNELQRQQQLVTQGFISKAKIDDATTNVKLTQARVAELKAALAVADLPARVDERAAASANAQAGRTNAAPDSMARQTKAEVAPQAGVISDVFSRAGEVVSPANQCSRYYLQLISNCASMYPKPNSRKSNRARSERAM